ncbi:putative ribonuclease H-like domain-containing protein [Tanacetum coccineum]
MLQSSCLTSVSAIIAYVTGAVGTLLRQACVYPFGISAGSASTLFQLLVRSSKSNSSNPGCPELIVATNATDEVLLDPDSKSLNCCFNRSLHHSLMLRFIKILLLRLSIEILHLQHSETEKMAIRLWQNSNILRDFSLLSSCVCSIDLQCTVDLHGHEEVYVCQPLGFEDPDFPDRVYKVEKALYGLHQALRAWYETLSTYLLENRFQRGKIHKTLFIRRDKSDILLVQVYVDDIIFGSTKKSLCIEFEKIIHKKFQMSSMASTPMETHKPLLKDADGEDVDEHLYRSMIRSLMYLTSLRPDIMFADSPFDLVAYTDSDYARASLDRKSTTRGCQFLGYRLISWQCKKQTMVANSTTEAKYVAASSCCGQGRLNVLICSGLELIKDDLKWNVKAAKDEIIVNILKVSAVKHTLTLSLSVGLITTPQMVINSPCLIHKKELAIPRQTATGKEFPNPLMAERELVRIKIDDGNAFWNETEVNAGDSKLMLLGINLLLLLKVDDVRVKLTTAVES